MDGMEGIHLGARPPTYTTKQGEAILAYLKEQKRGHVTALQVAEHFQGEKEGRAPIGRTTVYRQLERLVREGKAKKYVLDEASGNCFQYLGGCDSLPEHFHLKCEKCGALIHAHGEAAQIAASGIFQEYDFKVEASKTVFYGMCRSCRGADGQ
jgi:Fur family ferric uptake transcriptional regulator